MPQRIPIGIDDFRKLREGGLEYIDKSDLIFDGKAVRVQAAS